MMRLQDFPVFQRIFWQPKGLDKTHPGLSLH
jgi:hypothetical protein